MGKIDKLVSKMKSEFFYLPSLSSLNLFKMSSKQDQSIPVRYLTLDENLKQRQKVTQNSY